MKKFVLLFVAIFVSSCTYSDEKVREVLAAEGYENIGVGGYAWLACSEKDTHSNTFVAHKNGRRVEGVVCGGWFKNYTIRINKTTPLTDATMNSIKDEYELMADSIIRARQEAARQALIDSLRTGTFYND